MAKYLYLKCGKCGEITRALEYSVYWNTVYCNHCGKILLEKDKVTKKEYLQQHTINHRDPGEQPGVPREKIGIPLAKNMPAKETVETNFWYAVED